MSVFVFFGSLIQYIFLVFSSSTNQSWLMLFLPCYILLKIAPDHVLFTREHFSGKQTSLQHNMLQLLNQISIAPKQGSTFTYFHVL